ncbi:MAG: hypothetical protein Q9194_007702 [Teloschistes cf. exilis]
MERYQMTEEQAQDALRNSWQPALRVTTTDAILDDPLPSPEQFSQVCDFDAFVIGNISLSKKQVDWDNGFWAIGSILQEHLFINQLDKRIYCADYDAAADYDYANFQPCARDFGSLLAALLYYFRYVREFYVLDSDPQTLLFTREELISNTLRTSGIEASTNILAQLYS